LGVWDEVNERYHMSSRDWKEWFETRDDYEDGESYVCRKCGTRFSANPFITYLVSKGKRPILCGDCADDPPIEKLPVEKIWAQA